MRRLPLIRIPAGTRVFPFGSVPDHGLPASLTFHDTGLEVPADGDHALAIVGEGEGRRLLVETLLSRHRLHPSIPPPGTFPAFSDWKSPIPPIRYLTFARKNPTGEFTDFTARYGSLQEEDKETFRSALLRNVQPKPQPEAIEAVAKILRIQHLLDLPLVALSSGQTRRSRIAVGMLSHPRLLLLDDPFAGLDVQSREEIGDILRRINAGEEDYLSGGSSAESHTTPVADLMRLVLILRGQGDALMPRWITHVAEAMKGNVWVGSRQEYADRTNSNTATVHNGVDMGETAGPTSKDYVAQETGRGNTDAEPIVSVQSVDIAYGPKKVLESVSWTVYPNSRWHLQGSNGCGKTTLLSLVLGHHPKSYSIPPEHLKIFGKPRRSIPTPHLRSMIGHASPEIFAAFPRSMNLTAGEAIATGYEGVFSRRGVGRDQTERILSILGPFQDILESSLPKRTVSGTPTTTNKMDQQSIRERILNTNFSHFPPPQQALILFLRAIVSRPRLLILDEASQAMDEETWSRCRKLLEREWREIQERKEDQAVIVVSHWIEEVPWNQGEGQVLRLEDGRVVSDTK